VTHYERLRVRRDASAKEIRDAYRTAARAAHPDRHGDASAARMAEINEAYRVLADPVRRRRYDEQIAEPPASSSPPHASAVADEPVWPVYTDTTPARFPWRFMLVLATLGVGVVVLGLIFTKPSQEPAPDNLLRPADCVDIGPELDATEVLCSGPHDAVVQQLVPFGETCAAGSEGYRDRQGMGTACVVRVTP
jgi:hypothetical protein